MAMEANAPSTDARFLNPHARIVFLNYKDPANPTKVARIECKPTEIVTIPAKVMGILLKNPVAVDLMKTLEVVD